MRTPEFYSLPDERQNYIGEMFAALTTESQGPEAYAEAVAKRRIWPRPMLPGTDSNARLHSVLGSESPVSKQQLLEQQVDTMAQKRTGEDITSRSQQRKEALISPVGGGY